ncbi:uncharacterized protein BJX67DRAFT_352626 [Aspergillus lucknowensis]|uniref:Uncharacterized protein n=1 Tax=Aspergillus lucknowensis TaxID=176173 RepID=A0ABR4LSQ7_9EURO
MDSEHRDTAADTPAVDPSQRRTVSDLQDGSISTTLWYRIHVLLHDLETFTNPASAKRLDKVIDLSYIGPPYFTPEEASVIKNIKPDGKERPLEALVEERLRERLEKRNKKRVDSGDFRVCAAHDVAPILGEILKIDLKLLVKDNDFAKLVEKKGLNLNGESWRGLKKKSFTPTRKRR